MFKEGPGGHSKKVSGRTRGSYVLLLAMERSMRLTVGKLGTFDFPLGYYLYFGSALGGIEARVRRHLSGNGKHHWHIDFLADEAPVVDVWSAAGPGRLECIWARTAMALPETTIPAAGFGSSDCSCRAHLVHLTYSKSVVASTRAAIMAHGKARADLRLVSRRGLRKPVDTGAGQ